MPYSILNIPSEVTFLTPTGPMELRMSEHTPEAISGAAKTLKASVYVTCIEWDRSENLPVWGVLAASDGEIMKQFTSESSKPAVMYALMARKR